MRTLHPVIAALATSLSIAGPAYAITEDASNTYVKKFGAVGDGVNDDTFAFQQALAQVKAGGVVFLPDGNFTLTSTIVITKPVTIIGTGAATQLYNKNNQTLFRFVNVNNAAIRDVYLGSSSIQPGVSLIEFVNSHHNQINNVTMLGGYYGLHLKGSLLNTVIDLRSGTNFQGFFAPTSINNTWVMAEPFNGISANANTFIAPVLEGGTNGLVLTDGAGQGSVHIMGGTIEGVSGTGLTLSGTFLPSSITGLPTCGAGCGYLGLSGIELLDTTFDALFDQIRRDRRFDQAVFYEFGRNFWFYDPQLDKVAPFVTGYAILNRFLSMESAALSGAPFRPDLPFGEFKASILDDLFNTYWADERWTWRNTLAIDSAPPNQNKWGGADLAAAILNIIQRDGGFTAMQKFWQTIATLRSASTQEEAMLNFLRAGKAATGKDYRALLRDNSLPFP
jgi:Pectate lyase superfamily protein